MRYKIDYTNKFHKDLKLAKKRGLDENKLIEVVITLASGQPLPLKHRDHALSGGYAGARECHITPDWLLVYTINNTLCILTLVRTGTHSDLF